MAKSHLPCPTVFRLLLRCNPETGRLFYRYRARLWFTSDRLHKAWNTRFAGREALKHPSGKGYLAGDILGKKVRAHQAVWIICHGRFPDCQIDHINGDPKDNRITNLREATNAQNALNRNGWSNAASAYKGVFRGKRGKKWRAQIRGPVGKLVHLGTFETEREAALAYNEAAERFHGEWARLNTVV